MANLKKKLQGVNRLLKTIGEPPLFQEADYQLSYEAQRADEQIDDTQRQVLGDGFKFNTSTIDLIPDLSNYISTPPNALVIEFADSNLTVDDGLVFDRVNYTKKFESNVTATIIYNEDFEYIPSVVQEYILAQSAYVFQRNSINDPEMTKELKLVLTEAKMKLNVYKINQAKANFKDGIFNRQSDPSR